MPPPPRPERGRLVLIEDDQSSRSALATILRRAGFEVEAASTVKDGLSLIATPATAVLLDLMLPDGRGEEILSCLRSTGRNDRVIVTTGVSDPVRLENLTELGANAVLKKPLNLPLLMQQLNEGTDPFLDHRARDRYIKEE